MRREQLDHLIRAAAGVLGENEVIVVGSQSILASIGEEDLPRPHDLVVAKLVAGRPHDLVFVRELVRAGIVDPEVVGVRLGLVDARERRVPSARRALQALRRRSSGSAPPG